MNPVKRIPGLLTLSAVLLFVSGTNPRRATYVQVADHSSTTDASETTQAKISRAMSVGPTDIAKSAKIVDTDARGNTVVLARRKQRLHVYAGKPESCWGTAYVC